MCLQFEYNNAFKSWCASPTEWTSLKCLWAQLDRLDLKPIRAIVMCKARLNVSDWCLDFWAIEMDLNELFARLHAEQI